MRQASWFVCLVGVLASSAGAQDQIQWQPNLEAAQHLAAKTNRLVLIHFWAPWCGPCINMEKTVFAQPETGPALEPNFVMVKLNADDSRATARIYQVTTLPTDVIITPSGRLVAAIPSPSKAPLYIAQMNQAADGFKRLAQGSSASAVREPAPQNPYGAVQVSTSQNTAPAAVQGTEPQAAPYAAAAAAVAAPQQQALIPQYPMENNQNGQAQPGQASAAPVGGPGQSPVAAPAYTAAMAGAQPPAAAAPADALEGYCCVTLVDQKRWVKGDTRFGAIHRGRVYKFTSHEAQQRFLANPDAFSPVMQGNDPVVALDARQAVAGSREHGLFYQNRIYLFSSEDSLKRFQASPNRYAAEVTQAMR